MRGETVWCQEKDLSTIVTLFTQWVAEALAADAELNCLVGVKG